MRAGLLRYSMILQEKIETRPAMGAIKATYVDLAPCKCNVIVKTGTTKDSDSQLMNSQVIEFTIRYNVVVDEEMRIKYNGRIYKILFINPEVTKGSTTIMAEYLNKA